MNDSLLNKIDFLLSLSQKGECSAEELNRIVLLTRQHSEHMILGRFMGYSVSDYAFASLKWINSKDSIKIFETLFNNLSEKRKQEINILIEQKIYKDY